MTTTETRALDISFETEGIHAGRIYVDLPDLYRDRAESLPGVRRNNVLGRYTVPKTWNSILSLSTLVKELRWKLRPTPELAQWAAGQQKAWKGLTAAAQQLRKAEGPHQEGWYLHQEDGAAWLNAYPETGVGRILQDEMGCLAGDTIINLNRAGKGFKMRLDVVVQKFNRDPRGKGQQWREDIPTKVARAVDGVVQLGELVNAWYSGDKMTYMVTTDTGRTVRATDEHPFFTSIGWRRLDELDVGSEVMVNAGRSTVGKKKGRKPAYKAVGYMQHHPFVVWMGKRPTVMEHRLVAEAGLNGLDYQVFIDKVQAGSVHGLVFLDPAVYAVHHIDHNHRDNAPVNLAVLTHEAHAILHGQENKYRHVLDQVGTETVVSIEPYGVEPTYDIEVADDPHNFMANGFVVHNTGKTGTCIKALKDAKVPGPILIIAKESALDQAWAADFHKWADAEYRTVQITGTITKRRKLIQDLKDGKYDVGIIGHSNLKTHTRFENYDGLKKCVKCGGPRLTTGKVDKDGKPLPDIRYHTEIKIDEAQVLTGGATKGDLFAYCRHGGTCAWVSDYSKSVQDIMAQVMVHARKNTKISEVSEAQCQKHTKEFNSMSFAKVIVDEVHLARNAQAQFTQAVWGVTNYASPRVEPFNRWGLTGTPVNGTSAGAWSPLHWIGPENWPTRGSWIDYFCVEEQNWAGFTVIKNIKPDRIDEFHATYQAVTRRVLANQVLDLPPILRGGSLQRRLTMGTVQAKQYKEMAKKLQLAVTEGLITAQNAATQANRLSMLASGCGYPHPDNKPGQPQKMLLRAPSCKLDAIVEDWKEGTFDDGKVGMMFVSSQALLMVRQGLVDKGLLAAHDIVTIAGQLPKNDIDRGIAAFQQGRKKLVMLTYAKGGASITLTKAKIVAAVERSWNPDDNLQGVKRFHRIGSEIHDHVTVLDYVVDGTNEIEQLTRLDEKAESIDQITRDRDRLAKWFA